MTVQEMHVDFRLKMDKMANESNVSFNTAQIDWLLSEAQLNIVKYTARTSLDSRQSSIDRISSLLTTDTGLTPVQDTATTYKYTLQTSALSKPYMHYVNGEATIVEDDCTRTLPLRFIQHDDLYMSLRDPFNASGVDHVLFNFSSDGDNVVFNFYTNPDKNQSITNVNITYIRVPKRIFSGGYLYLDGTTTVLQGPELPEHVHGEIVDYAVLSASTNVEDPQLIQLKTIKLQNNK